MNKKFISGGCSFTFGHELSDDNKGKIPSKLTWAYLLKASPTVEYICSAQMAAAPDVPYSLSPQVSPLSVV